MTEIDRALRLSEDVLLHLSERPDQLLAFLRSSGLAPEDLRRQAGSAELAAALLDHLVADEAALLDCAAAIGRRPAELMAARTVLSGPGSYGWSVD